MRRLGVVFTAAFALMPAIIVACNSETIVSSSSGFGGSAGIPTAIGSEEGPSGRPVPEDRCPSTVPVEDGSCIGQSGTCDYGVDVREQCNIQAYCNGNRWSVTPSSCQVNCPKTRAEVVPGTACDDANMGCSWLEGTCACVGASSDAGVSNDAGGDAGEGGAPLKKGTWVCVPPPSAESLCPLSIPKSGATCVKSISCDYGSCALDRELTFQCSGHMWSKTTPKCAP